MAALANLSGLAAQIRSATESETFNLSVPPTTITNATLGAFATPFDSLPAMIRLTFVVGGGKLARGSYDPSAHKVFTAALRECGYEEDKGGGMDWSSAGTYKSQHDTGRNLKTIVVFPKIDRNSATPTAADSSGSHTSSATPTVTIPEEYKPFYDKKSPESMSLVASLPVFSKMGSSKTPSWSSKRAMVASLGVARDLLESLANQLMTGKSLTDYEQEIYDNVTLDNIGEKESKIKKEMAEQVDSGNITKEELDQLKEQVESK